MIHFPAFRFLPSDTETVIGIVVFYLAGYRLNLEFDLITPAKPKVSGPWPKNLI